MENSVIAGRSATVPGGRRDLSTIASFSAVFRPAQGLVNIMAHGSMGTEEGGMRRMSPQIIRRRTFRISVEGLMVV